VSRIRTIKPDFWTDEKLAECSIAARLLFIGMWNFADDCGNLGRSSKKLKMQVFPADAIDCEQLVIELITHGMLTEYSVSGEKFLQIKNFLKHQLINRPSKSNIPPPKPEHSDNTHGALTESSLTEGKGREGNGKEGRGGEREREPFSHTPPPAASAPPDFSQNPQCSGQDSDPSEDAPSPEPAEQLSPGENPSPQSARRLPADWRLTDADRAFCTEHRPDLNPDTIAANFAEHWHAAQGRNSVKADWSGQWRMWVRKEHLSAAPPGGAAPHAITVPGPVGRDPVLEKIDADRKRAAPIPDTIRAQLAALKTHGVAHA
jgi:hypothetical protein